MACFPQDDILNEEIEQEHLEEKISKEEEKVFNEKLKNKNLKPLVFEFRFSAVKFIDMAEFNKEKYYPYEIKEKEEQYIRKLCSDANISIKVMIQTLLKKEDFTVKNYHFFVKPYKEQLTKEDFINEIINELNL